MKTPLESYVCQRLASSPQLLRALNQGKSTPHATCQDTGPLYLLETLEQSFIHHRRKIPNFIINQVTTDAYLEKP